MEKNAIKNHDFGYGQSNIINKIMLKNVDELKEYLSQLINDNFFETKEIKLVVNNEIINI